MEIITAFGGVIFCLTMLVGSIVLFLLVVAAVIFFLPLGGAFVIANIGNLVDWIKTPKVEWEARKKERLDNEAKRKKEEEERLKTPSTSLSDDSAIVYEAENLALSKNYEYPNSDGGPSPGYGGMGGP